MKKLKLFEKTYLFTMILMGTIIIVSHTLIYIFLPAFYVSKTKNEVNKISRELIECLEKEDKDGSINLARDFAQKYNISIDLILEDKIYKFKSLKKFTFDVDYEFFYDNQFVMNSDNYVLEETHDYNSETEKDMTKFEVNNNTILENRSFTTYDGLNGRMQITMDMQSFKEARGVIFDILPYSLIISIIISLIASYIYARVITKPIKEICNSTRDMKELDENACCIINTGDEIELLADNINSLYKTLWETIESLKKEINNVSQSEQAKVDFLRSSSHELKTPLMSIHIMLENMILNVGKYKNHDLYLSKCKDIVVDLSSMIQEILDTSKLNGYKNLEYKCINLENFIEKICDPYKIIAKFKHIDMSIDYSFSFNVDTDEKLLEKALSNIISNAVNYTDNGSRIKIYFNENSLIIENECSPISDEDLNNIFDAFYRVDFDRNKNTGGNGLGLYIVKQILTILNMPYSFESMDNGMRFAIDFKYNIHISD